MRRFVSLASKIVPLALVLLLGATVAIRCNRHEKTDAEFRSELLDKTPLGTRAPHVLSFVHELQLHGPQVAGYRPPVDATPDRTIAAIVKIHSVGFVAQEHVKATWHFDESDRLSDITIERYTIG